MISRNLVSAFFLANLSAKTGDNRDGESNGHEIPSQIYFELYNFANQKKHSSLCDFSNMRLITVDWLSEKLTVFCD
jgi:hypothetical protein